MSTLSENLEPIHSAAALRELCSKLHEQTSLALDTEFERSRTFFVRPALIQIADDHGIHLIDPTRIDDLSPLAAILVNPDIEKVLHSASEDLEVIERLCEVTPRPLFDTQIAAALAGHRLSPSYRSLVAQTLGVTIAKEETRSDWLRRPLTSSQLAYAALDVCFLLPLRALLAERLSALGRLGWHREECERLLAKRAAHEEHAEAYLKLGNLHHLDRRGLGVLRALCAWREHEARAQDIPRAHLVKDEVLLGIARRRPDDRAGLLEIDGLPSRLRGRLANVVIAIVRKVMQLDEAQLPPRVPAPSERRRHRAKLRALKARVASRAAELGIAPELLGRNSALEALVIRVLVANIHGLTPHFEGWRASIIGNELLGLLTEEMGEMA